MLQRRILLWLIILLIGAFSLGACGGGDDDGAPAPTATGTTTRFAVLDGAQAGVTANPTIGTGILIVNADTGAVSGSITITTATASPIGLAHVHEGATGVSGGIVITLQGTAGTNTGTWSVPAGITLTTAQINSFIAGNLYFAVHTSAAGEPQSGGFRGQINRTSVTLNASLDGTQEVPPVTTSAAGTGSLTVNVDTGAVSGALTITVSPATTIGAAHVHSGARGVNGDVLIPLTNSGGGVWSVPANTTPLTQAQKELFIAGNLYFNVHTATVGGFPGGEIRGQIDLIAP